MEIIDKTSAFQSTCKNAKKYGMYLNIPLDYYNPVAKLKISAPWLNEEGIEVLAHDEELIVLFDSEEELNKAYDNTYGDDTVDAFDNATIHIYCLTCAPDGELMTENT